MARKDGKAETQHHTPKMLLKNFVCKPDGQAIHVFDKHCGKPLLNPTSIDNVGGQRRYYDAEVQGGIVSMEGALSALETATNPIVQKIIEQRSLKNLTKADRITLALFCAVQFIRVPRMREAHLQIATSIVDKSKVIAPNASNLEDIEKSLENNSIKLANIRHIADGAIKLVPVLLAHDWLLLEPNKENRFWISDCPVVLHNDRTFGPYGNLGFAVPGIQIYLPLSPTCVLSFWERSILAQGRDALKDARKLFGKLKLQMALGAQSENQQLSKLASDFEKEISPTENRHAAIDRGQPIVADEDNTTFLNSLQYTWSYRFLMSSVPNFELAERMCAEQPDLRTGIKIRTD